MEMSRKALTLEQELREQVDRKRKEQHLTEDEEEDEEDAGDEGGETFGFGEETYGLLSAFLFY